MRTFIALGLPEGFAYEVEGLVRVLRQRVEGRWVPAENYHITLTFLGEIGEAQAAVAIATLEEACAGRGPLRIESDGLGIFGKPRNATLWMGVRGESLVSLAEDMRRGLDERGIAYDPHAFRPHVTLARHARMAETDLGDLPFPALDEAREVTLFRSTLTPDGPIYKPLHIVSLGISCSR